MLHLSEVWLENFVGKVVVVSLLSKEFFYVKILCFYCLHFTCSFCSCTVTLSRDLVTHCSGRIPSNMVLCSCLKTRTSLTIMILICLRPQHLYIDISNQVKRDKTDILTNYSTNFEIFVK